MRSYFAWNNKVIKYIYLGVEYPIARLQTSLRPDTLAKTCEGLNHFLYYYFLKENDEYEELTSELFKFYIKTKNTFTKSRNVHPSRQEEELMAAIAEVGRLSTFLIDKAAEYVENNSVPSIDEKKASTDITLSNETALLLTGMSVLMKLCFLYVNNANLKMRWIDTIPYYDHYLLNEMNRNLMKYNDKVPDNNVDKLLEFIYARVDVLWKDSPESFRDKFHDVGLDIPHFGTRNKVDVFSALKKYIPPVLTYEIAEEIYECRDKEDLKNIYWTEGKEFKHFQFVNQNVAAFIQTVLKNINSSQNKQEKIIDVNVADILIENAGEDNNNRKEITLYEDKTKHLYYLRKKTSTELFKKFTDELAENYPDYLNIVDKFKISKDHGFNQYILGLILLSMTGECLIYRDVLGVYAKVLLCLFYLRAKSSDIFEGATEILDIMLMDPAPTNLHFTEEFITKYFEENDSKFTNKATVIHQICTGYHSGDKMIILDPFVFDQLLNIFSNPSVMRNILFPNRYDIQSPEDNASSTVYNPLVYDYLNDVLSDM